MKMLKGSYIWKIIQAKFQIYRHASILTGFSKIYEDINSLNSFADKSLSNLGNPIPKIMWFTLVVCMHVFSYLLSVL